MGFHCVRTTGLFCLALLSFDSASESAIAQGRGDYFNVESPQVHPIEIATVDGHDYLLVCNTPDNSIEIYDTDELPGGGNVLLSRVPVGLEPVSVRYFPELGVLVTANFLGDSISLVRLAVGAGDTLEASFQSTNHVGDEPLDIAHYVLETPDGDLVSTLFVTFMNPDAFGWFKTSTLDPVFTGAELIEAAVPLHLPEIQDVFRQALKQPRTILVDDGRLLILGHKVDVNPPLDFSLNCRKPASLLSGELSGSLKVGGLGTTNFNMAVSRTGEVFVVGSRARNDLKDEPNVASAPSGFVTSVLYRVQDACSGTAVIQSRDVNLETRMVSPVPSHLRMLRPGDRKNPALLAPIATPVDRKRALAQLTDVALFETDEAIKVFVAAFGSDRVGVIEVAGGQDPSVWPIRRVQIEPLQTDRAGPRGLALKFSHTARNGDPGPRLYVLNRMDNSVTVIDPEREKLVGAFTLRNDPRPEWIRAGQQFLYSADLSGNGFVSCASCHVDGRTDGLPWDLGTPEAGATRIDPLLLDGRSVLETETFPADKNNMVTQSLQGLLNWETEPGTTDLVTNAPYHWRADRKSLESFNSAFETLLLGNRLSDLEMTAFAEFVNSIHYGPNARQPRNRKYSGDFGDPDIFVFDPTISDGSRGALRGLKIFHTVATLQQSPCVRCHSLPEGSNNLITVNNAPTESAALRGLVQKEAKRDEDGFSDPAETAYTGFYGMFHAGFLGPLPPDHPLHLHLINPVATVNSFINLVFQATLCPGQEPFCPDGQMTAQFVHELDTGIGPMVGRALTVRNDDLVEAFVPTTTGCDPRDSSLDGLLDCMEEQARQANSGVVVQGQVAGLRRGFWYSATDRLYSEEPSATLFTRRHLLDLVNLPQDHLTFTASPLGSERRLAAQSSASQIIAPGPRPSSLELLPMVPSIANREIPSQDRAWADLDNEKQKSRFVHRLRVYQHVLVEKGRELRRAGQPDYGLDRVRHDAPRRFRVAGRGIRHGAKMQLFTYERLAETMPTAIGTLPLTEASVASLPTRTTELPIFATSHRTPEGLTIWETAVELEPLVYYRLMLGWMSAPGVSEVFHDLDQCPSTKANEPPCFRFSDPPTPEEIDLFEPDLWNWHFVRVLNSDGASGDGGWQRLRIE